VTQRIIAAAGRFRVRRWLIRLLVVALVAVGSTVMAHPAHADTGRTAHEIAKLTTAQKQSRLSSMKAAGANDTAIQQSLGLVRVPTTSPPNEPNPVAPMSDPAPQGGITLAIPAVYRDPGDTYFVYTDFHWNNHNWTVDVDHIFNISPEQALGGLDGVGIRTSVSIQPFGAAPDREPAVAPSGVHLTLNTADDVLSGL
jgi:hypothetical protein